MLQPLKNKITNLLAFFGTLCLVVVASLALITFPRHKILAERQAEKIILKSL